MQTTVTERKQTSIPAAICKQFHIKPGMGLQWVVLPEGIYIRPVPEDPIKATRGKYPGLFKPFMESRQEERKREREQEDKWKKK